MLGRSWCWPAALKRSWEHRAAEAAGSVRVITVREGCSEESSGLCRGFLPRDPLSTSSKCTVESLQGRQRTTGKGSREQYLDLTRGPPRVASRGVLKGFPLIVGKVSPRLNAVLFPPNKA